MLTLAPTISNFSTTDSPTFSSSPPPSLSPSPTPILLPPSERDFEIHRLALVEFLSTRRIAEKFRISQTRVRQIIGRVAGWITDMLPLKSEQDAEKEKRYAIYLAAAQLQHQIEELQNFWNGTSDPKYQRQQTRAITALARLGVASHHLDSLATQARSASEGSGSEDALHVPAPQPTPASIEPSSPLATPNSALPTFPPPSEDCSPPTPQASDLKPQGFPATTETPLPANDLLLEPSAAKDTLAGLDIMEKRLLSMIDYAHGDAERQNYLQNSLNEIRQSRANFVLQLGPNHPVTTRSSATEQQFPLPVGEG